MAEENQVAKEPQQIMKGSQGKATQPPSALAPAIWIDGTPPSWLMIPHHRGSVSTAVAHDTPLSWLGIHRHGS